MPYKDKFKKAEYQKEYQEKNKQKLAEYQREYKKNHKDEIIKKFLDFKSKNQKSLICKSCKKQFKRRLYDSRDKGKFCSSKCALAKVRTKKHQRNAASKAAQVIIKKYRGTGTKTYVKENRRHQHRIVMEKIIGRKLRKGEIVHHIDENKKNNDPNNLQVMTQSEHARLHFSKIRPPTKNNR
jgi:hypothetical protein